MTQQKVPNGYAFFSENFFKKIKRFNSTKCAVMQSVYQFKVFLYLSSGSNVCQNKENMSIVNIFNFFKTVRGVLFLYLKFKDFFPLFKTVFSLFKNVFI